MKTILIADDDRDLLEPICAYLSKRESNLETIPATSGSECIEILKTRKIDLVLSDLRMPDGDGIDVLAYISRHYSSLPVVVMSAHIEEENTEDLARFGNLRFLGKPASLDQIFQTIEEALGQTAELGNFNGFSLAGVLQLIEMEEKTCLLELTRDGSEQGCFAFVNGRIMRAACGQTQGEDAALEMLIWDQPGIKVHHLPHGDQIESEFSGGVTQLLMRSVKGQDESRVDNPFDQGGEAHEPDDGSDPVGDLFSLAVAAPYAVQETAAVAPATMSAVMERPEPEFFARDQPQADERALQLKHSEPPEPEPITRDPMEPTTRDSVEFPGHNPMAAALPTSAAYTREVHVEHLSPVPGIMVFLFVTGLMVGYQWQAARFADFLPFYTWSRNIMVLVAFWLVVADAFQSGLLQAALCVFLPPYTIVYATSRLTSYILRGLFLAALVVLAAELYFIPEESVALALQGVLAGFIESVDGLILRAGS